jgi:hypothetical protein
MIKKLLGGVAVLAAIILIGSIDSIVDAIVNAGYAWALCAFDVVAGVIIVHRFVRWARL